MLSVATIHCHSPTVFTPRNLSSDKLMVVYNIDVDGAYCFSLLIVAGAAGAQRLLDELELVCWMRRRLISIKPAEPHESYQEHG